MTIDDPDQVYFKMNIDSNPAHSWYTDGISVTEMRTNDPNTAHYMFVDGQQLPKGTAVNLATFIPCNKKVRVAWEDGGGFEGQDFFFYVTGKCAVGEGSPVRLTR